MEIKVERRWKKATYTIGRLYVDGIYFCNTLEDADRGLKQTDGLDYISKVKIYGETAIPAGRYPILMDVVSPKYSGVAWYNNLCGGKMPRLQGVPGFEGVLIHPGNSALDTYGCILVGKNKIVGGLIQSKDTFRALYNRMSSAHKLGEKVYISIS